jgi:hypothetical protein
MPAARLADLAGQVLCGRIVEVRSYWADNPRRIESEVVLHGVEYWKGGPPQPGDSFRLVVPGGQVGDTGQRVCCTPEFRVGQRWVLFLLPEYRSFPVAGLWQGAFQLVPDAQGVERVVQGGALPVAALQADGFFRALPASDRAHGSSHAIAADNARLVEPRQPLLAADGDATAASAAAPAAALSLDDFRAALQPILAASRQHELTGPAGRRVLVQYRPVPLRTSGPASPLDPARLPAALEAVAEQPGSRP